MPSNATEERERREAPGVELLSAFRPWREARPSSNSGFKVWGFGFGGPGPGLQGTKIFGLIDSGFRV